MKRDGVTRRNGRRINTMDLVLGIGSTTKDHKSTEVVAKVRSADHRTTKNTDITHWAALVGTVSATGYDPGSKDRELAYQEQ